jgi:hypothetical protein
MALTKDQWFKKLSSLVQPWVTQETNARSVFKGMAAILEQAQLDYEKHISETFIDTATDEYVALQGNERSVFRLNGESLSSYRSRVKRIVNQSNLPAIKALVDSLLIRGESTIIEHSQFSGSFLNREFFLNRNIIDYQVLYNAFTILIDFQIPEATSFYNRGSFLNREFLTGSSLSSDEVFNNIIQAVNANKAYGTVYRLIERANP